MLSRAVVFLSVASMTVLFAGSGMAHGAQPNYSEYVALGDSYTSGPLIPFTRLDPLGCVRSTNNYPAWLADKLDVDSYVDVSCAGADTTHMTEPQSVPLGWNPPQLDALQPGTDLVTLGIGGNDFGVFGSLIDTCPALRDDNPTGSPCHDHYTVDGVDTIKEKISRTQERVVTTLADIHERSPDATVVLVGYPRIAPPSGYCPDILPFADGDMRWLDSVEQTLNAALATAAAIDGDTRFVDMYPASYGHDACAGYGAAWIQGKDLDLFGAAPYHPNKNGAVGVASVLADTLTGQPVTEERTQAAISSAQEISAPDSVAGIPVTRGEVPLGSIPNSVDVVPR